MFKKIRVKIVKVKPKYYKVYGKGLGSFNINKNKTLDCGNSGTTARLITGLLSTNPGIKVKITGDHSLKKRNMSKLIKLMKEFGATFYPEKKRDFH